MCESAEGFEANAGGKKTCQNEIAALIELRQLEFRVLSRSWLVSPLSRANTLAPGCKLITKA